MNRSLLRTITEEEIQTYESDGIVCLRGIFDSDWVRYVRDAIDNVPGGYADRSFLWPIDGAFRDLAFASPVGEIGATLMGSDTCGLLIDILFVKDPHSEDLTRWHHDQPYYRTQGTQLCGMWIGFDSTTLENGGMKWIRGSHKWGKVFDPVPFDGTVTKDIYPGREQAPDIDANPNEFDIVHFDTEPGDCIVDHSLILHSAGPNITDRPRRAITYALYGDDARYDDIPPTRGMEDSRDFGLKPGESFPPDHSLAPRIWPCREDPSTWPRPTSWSELPGVATYRDNRAFEDATHGGT